MGYFRKSFKLYCAKTCGYCEGNQDPCLVPGSGKMPMYNFVYKNTTQAAANFAEELYRTRWWSRMRFRGI